ncbi:MAG: DUF4338 domain-containing protein [Thiotrichales bacterium]|nr:DUF4338 domain-containing protein [Thiotrichales bacterium]
MTERRNTDAFAPFAETPAGFDLADVRVRLAHPGERARFDALMDRHHYLGFYRPVASGLRYIAEWRGKWVALAAWQGGAFKCQPRDMWIGWHPDQRHRRLDLIANNTRFLVLSGAGVFPNLASMFLAAMVRRLGDDWLAFHGKRALVAETFCDPGRYSGTMYRAAGWRELGFTKGYARANGSYVRHNRPKRLFVRILRRDAKRLLSRDTPLPETVVPPSGPELAPRRIETLRSICAGMETVPDHRRVQCRRHSLATVLTVRVLAELANMKGCVAAARLAGTLGQEELAAIGAWRNPRSGKYEPVSKSTLHRVMQSVDPDLVEGVIARSARPLRAA